MSTKLNPDLGFRDTAKQAMEFYRSVFGGELTLSTFGDFQASEDPTEQDKIMHGTLVTETGPTLMGADTPNSMSYTPRNSYSVSLSGGDEAELRRFWEELSPEGTIAMPLERAPWGDFFGICAGRQVRRQLAHQYRHPPIRGQLSITGRVQPC
jgi:PhnB protein